MAAGDHLLFGGTVFAKESIGGKVFRKRFLSAKCGGIEDQPAKLELFKYNKDVLTKAKIFELSFCKVVRVQHQLMEDGKQSIVLTTNDRRQLSFYTELDEELKKWLKYCVTLQRIPNYSIPKLSPKVKPGNLGKCSDTVTRRLNALSAWEVFVMNTGVGHVLSCAGKQVITLGDKYEGFFSVNSFHTKKCLHTWSKSELRTFGCVDSLVYVEFDRQGLLWMYCSCDTMAVELSKTIHRCASHDKYTSSSSSVEAFTRSYDSGIGSSSSSHQANGILEATTQATTGSHSKRDFTFDDQSMPLDNLPLESYVDGQQKVNDLNHTPDLDSHLGNTTTTAGHKYETFITSFPPMNNVYKGVSARPYKRTNNASPYLATKKQQVISQSLPPNLTQGIEKCRVDHELGSHCQQQRIILWRCCPEMKECLNITEVLPYLMSEHLIAETDLDILRNKTSTRVDKILHLMDVLPKIPYSLKTFITCLRQSSNGTAHNEIAQRLKQLIDSSQLV